MGNYSKLGKNIGLITIGSFASKLLNVLFVPFYTDILSTSEYGIADIITTTVTLLFPIFSTVICEAMMRYALETPDNSEKIYANGMLVWFLGFLALTIFSPILNLFSAFRGNVMIFVLYYFSYSLYFNVSYFSRGIEKVAVYAVAGIVQTAFAIALNILFLAIFKLGMEGYLFAYIIADFTAALFIIIGAKLYRFKLRSIDKQLLKQMLMLSLPMIPTQIGWWITNSSDKYMLIYISGAAIAGVYSISYKIPSIMNVLIGIFSSAWRISSVDGYGSEENKKFYNDIFKKYYSLSIVVSSIIILMNKILAAFLYSKDFFIAYRYVPILVFAVMLNGLSDFAGSVYIAAKKTKMLFVSTGIGALINVILNLLLIPFFEAYGAALATLISYFVMWLLRLYFCKSIIPLKLEKCRDYISLLLLLLEVLLVSVDNKISYFISSIVLISILIGNKSTIYYIINVFFGLVKRRKNND